MKEDRGPWYLLTGIVLGIGLGLMYSWIVSPVEFIDNHPISLRGEYKDQYRSMIAVAYAATGNLERAKDRLALLADGDSAVVLVAQAQRTLADAGDFVEAQALANLAAVLGQAPASFNSETINTISPFPSHSLTPLVTDLRTPTPNDIATRSLTEELTSTPIITITLKVTDVSTGTSNVTRTLQTTQTLTLFPTPTSTRTPTPTLAPPFVLDNLVEVCDLVNSVPQIQVFLSNAAGVGIPGVEIIISWNGGEEHFFTGLKTDIDIGYADFVMEPEVVYVLQVADGGQLITDLIAPQCTNVGNESYWGSLRLVFSHP